MSNIRPEDKDCIQVVMIEPVAKAFEEWIESRGLHLFKIPGMDDVDDLPTYSVGIKP